MGFSFYEKEKLQCKRKNKIIKMTEENIEECSCSSFEKKTNYLPEFLEGFNIIASSNIKDRKKGVNATNTKIIQCKECNSYYILDNYNKEYPYNEKISLRKYSPKVNDNRLRKILKTAYGTIGEYELDDRSQLLKKLKKIEINRIFHLNDSKN
jgi:hypothetical protein